MLSDLTRENDKLLTPEQVAERLGKPIRTLESWRRRKKGPPCVRLNINKDVRYPLSKLIAWENQLVPVFLESSDQRAEAEYERQKAS